MTRYIGSTCAGLNMTYSVRQSASEIIHGVHARANSAYIARHLGFVVGASVINIIHGFRAVGLGGR